MSEARVPTHCAVVLAAGRSLRLGESKQLLQIDGETLLHRAARLALATRPSRLFVVLDPADHRLLDAVDGLPCAIVPNHWPERGMASSLHAAARWVVDQSAVLVLGCDQPALTTRHLQALLDAAAVAAGRCAATCARGVSGIPAVVPGAWFDALTPEGGSRGFGARLRALPPEDRGDVVCDALARDVDSPADLAQLRAEGVLDRPA